MSALESIPNSFIELKILDKVSSKTNSLKLNIGEEVKFQNLGENGAEAHFKWEPKSGCFIPHEAINDNDPMPWE